MRKNTIIVATVSVVTLGTTAQSCLALATSSVGIAIIKQVLLGGITKGLNIFKNKDAFLQNDLINAAMPQSLVKINNVLQTVAPNLVSKEKDYIAQAAAYTVNISEPILTNAVNNLNADDVTRIANGTTATQILKEKTSEQLVAAIMPKVDEKLNSFGIVKSMNTALSANNLLGSLFGNGTSGLSATGSLSKLASEQMVNGLFSIVEQHEQQNQNNILNALKGLK